MNGLWLLSYLSLWILVILLTIIVLGLVKQLGALYVRLGPEENLLSTDEGLEPGSLAPGVNAVDIVNGKDISSIKLKGKPSLLIFISPGCSPCLKLLPDIVTFHRDWKNKVNLLIFIQGDGLVSEELVESHRLRIPTIPDPENAFSKLFKVRAMPFVYLLDPDDIVQRRGIVNNRDGLEALMEDQITPEVMVPLPKF